MRTLAVAGAAVFVMSVAGAPTAAAEPEWTMPSLRGMSMAEAQAAYAEAVSDSGGPALEVVNEYVNGWPIQAPTMWDVCSQSPSAGKALTAESWTGIGVDKRGQCS